MFNYGHVFPPIMTILEPSRTQSVVYKIVCKLETIDTLPAYHNNNTRSNSIRYELTGTLFEHCCDNVTSRVKNTTPPGRQVFQPTGTIFKLVQDIIGTKHTKSHEDRTINVALNGTISILRSGELKRNL
ncbi:hypothetical protein DPMN_010486 [Dreissena polymorpha]|uniref:Uncharacterized protein n=1 Tax=Dreissena polymorpha TaxID=45954 RepID=A0A9D4N1L4_DREPO|nr:hypothetical protein DPMN_010486 [Dreissena polymorpha]